MRSASLIASALLCAGIASAGNITLVSSRAAISATDTIDWSTQGNEFDVKTSGTTVGCNAFTLSGASVLTLFSGSTYAADFLATDTVLAAFDVANAGAIPGAIRITFATAVGAAGAQLQITTFGLPFTGVLEAFGTSGSFGTVSLAGLSVPNPPSGDGSAPFIGIRSDLTDIIAIEFRTANDGTAINNVSIGAAALVKSL